MFIDFHCFSLVFILNSRSKSFFILSLVRIKKKLYFGSKKKVLGIVLAPRETYIRSEQGEQEWEQEWEQEGEHGGYIENDSYIENGNYIENENYRESDSYRERMIAI